MMMKLAWLNDNEFYQAIAGKKVDSLDDCPILSKVDYEKGIELLNKKYKYTQPFWSSVYWSLTGGSTSSQSKNMYFPNDIDENHLQRQHVSESLKHMGVFTSQDVMINLFTGGNAYRSLELFNDLSARAGVTSLPIGVECSDALLHKFVIDFSPTIIAGSPSRISKYADYCLENDLKVPCDQIMYAASSLYPAQKEKIREAFGVQRITSIYGSAETGPWAYSDSNILDANQFIIADKVSSVEIINPDEKGYGDIVVTNKLRKRFPVIRYSLGDIGRVEVQNINGTEYHILEVKGRNTQWVSFSDIQIELHKFANILSELMNWQIIQKFDSDGDEIIQINIYNGSKTNSDFTKLQEVLDKLCKVKSYSGALKAVVIQRVEYDELVKSKISNKIIKLVDVRKVAPQISGP
jgi:phenylacetate-CoA ligase